MEGRRPPDDDNLFEWTDSPPRSGRRHSERSFDTGESDIYETGEREGTSFDPGTEERTSSDPGIPEAEEEVSLFGPGIPKAEEEEEGTSLDPEPGPEDPYESWREGPAERGTGEWGVDTGEWEALDTGEREALDTGEREAYEADRARRKRPGRRGRRRGRRRDRGARAETTERRRARTDTLTDLLRRHRDLPASVRRRQAGAVILVAAIVLVGGIVLASGGDGGGDEKRPLGLKRLAGQTIVARMDQGGPDKRLLRQARKGQIGGVFISPDDDRGLPPKRLRRDVARIQKATREGDNPPLLVMTDQEGGFVRRLDGPPNLAPNDLGEVGDAAIATSEGQSTGEFLRRLGVNVDLAPLLDVETEDTADTISTRTFSDDPEVVSTVGVGFIEGMQSAGVSATAKHFPGLGLAPENTDFQSVEISASPEDQEAALAPFQAAVDAGVDLVMMSSAIYPDLGSAEPAAFTREIVEGRLRRELGFQGLVITDDLEARAIADVADPRLAGVRALQAGNDLLLFAQSEGISNRVLDVLVRAVKGGRLLERSAIEAAYERIVTFKSRLEEE